MTMSRSAVDATRFTATSPHAYSKPTAPRSDTATTNPPSSAPRSQASRSHPIPGRNGTPGPGTVAPNGGETPKEKVARLRAAHEAAKRAQLSRWDHVVVRGRVWADTAHKYFTLGLIGLTGVAGVVTVYAFVDMVVHNRRKQRIYFAEQHILLQEKLAEATEAAEKGEADEHQMLLLNRKRAADEAEQAAKQRKERGGLWASAKEMLLGGMKKAEEESEERVNEGGVLSVLGEEGLMKMRDGPEEDKAADGGPPGSATTGPPESHTSRGWIVEAVEQTRREGERVLEKNGVEGGPLDRLAHATVEAGKAETGKAPGG